MRDIAVVGFAQTLGRPRWRQGNDIEILLGPIQGALDQAGLTRDRINFTTGGSNDFLVGQAFSFVRALDAVGVHPCKEDSHVEMDAAWALYEAWIRLQLGDIDTALIWGLGITTMGNMDALMTLSVDPYYMSPLGPDPTSLAALQARHMLDAGLCTEADLAEIASRHQASAAVNPHVRWTPIRTPDQILAEPCTASPLRPSTSAPSTDGACAMVLAAGDLARSLHPRPAWIRGLDHRTDPHNIGVRPPLQAPSAALAGQRVGANTGAPFDLAELHACWAHEELLLRQALSLPPDTPINPSGGPLCANPVMATGLIRMGEAAQRILDGSASRVLAHATTGPWLQSNLVAVMEASS